MLCSCLYDTIFYQLTQLLFCPSSITYVNSMDASYIPIAEARGFTTHWIKIAARAIHSARSITFKPDSYSHTQYLFPDSPDFRGMPTLQHHLPAEQHRKAFLIHIPAQNHTEGRNICFVLPKTAKENPLIPPFSAYMRGSCSYACPSTWSEILP